VGEAVIGGSSIHGLGGGVGEWVQDVAVV